MLSEQTMKTTITTLEPFLITAGILIAVIIAVLMRKYNLMKSNYCIT
jgi:hypothetical protein